MLARKNVLVEVIVDDKINTLPFDTDARLLRRMKTMLLHGQQWSHLIHLTL